jgi:hypothetical protein
MIGYRPLFLSSYIARNTSMSSTYVDCPECGFESKVEDELLAQPIECPNCKKSFTVEPGDSYGVDGAPPPPSGSSGPDSEEPEAEEPDIQPGKSWLEAWPQD